MRLKFLCSAPPTLEPRDLLGAAGDQEEISQSWVIYAVPEGDITAYLLNDGTIEGAQAIAAHESPRTTKLYDRTSDEITLDEVERIRI
jgi:hypothetical protein